MSDKPKKKTGHMMGKNCGYELLSDGSIKLAPVYSGRFDDILDQRNAIRATLESVTTNCASLDKVCMKGIRETWKRIEDDYGINGSWEYAGNGIIRIVPKQEPSK